MTGTRRDGAPHELVGLLVFRRRASDRIASGTVLPSSRSTDSPVDADATRVRCRGGGRRRDHRRRRDRAARHRAGAAPACVRRPGARSRPAAGRPRGPRRPRRRASCAPTSATPRRLEAVVRGSDVVVSAVHGLGSRERGITPESVDHRGNVHLVDAAASGGRDVVLVSVVGASPTWQRARARQVGRRGAPAPASGAPWTIVRATAYEELWTEIIAGSAARDGRAVVPRSGGEPGQRRAGRPPSPAPWPTPAWIPAPAVSVIEVCGSATSASPTSPRPHCAPGARPRRVPRTVLRIVGQAACAPCGRTSPGWPGWPSGWTPPTWPGPSTARSRRWLSRHAVVTVPEVRQSPYISQVIYARPVTATTTSDTYLTRIGNLIRDARKHRGSPSSSSPTLLGTSQSAVNRIEQGHQNLSLEMLARIGEALDSEIVSLGAGPHAPAGHRRRPRSRARSTSRPRKNAGVALLCASPAQPRPHHAAQGRPDRGGQPAPRGARQPSACRPAGSTTTTTSRSSRPADARPERASTRTPPAVPASSSCSSARCCTAPDAFELPYAGGCDLGTRTVEPHMAALRPFGLEVKATDGLYHATRQPGDRARPGRSCSPSAATPSPRTPCMAAALHPGTTIIRNASPQLHGPGPLLLPAEARRARSRASAPPR